MGLRGQPESSVDGIRFNQQGGVGVDGDFTRYQGSMHKVHELSGRHFCMNAVNLGGTAGAIMLLSLFIKGQEFFICPEFYFPVGVCTDDTRVIAQKGAENDQKNSQTHFFDGGSDADPVVQHTCGYEGAA